LKATAPIGVFDSGVGGLSVLRALRAELPHEDFVYFADTGNAPYGERDEAFVAERSAAVARSLIQEHSVKALVVACNTATAAAIHLLRAAHIEIPIVGVEPALKPAALHSRTRRVAVLATRATLRSAKFEALLRSVASDAQFVLQPCDGLATAIESGDDAQTARLCLTYLRQAGQFGREDTELDTLVLGCTHYPFALAHFEAHVGAGVRIIETGQPVALQTRRLLQAKNLLRGDGVGRMEWRTTGATAPLRAAAGRWLGL
jgi:glutamate racemase